MESGGRSGERCSRFGAAAAGFRGVRRRQGSRDPGFCGVRRQVSVACGGGIVWVVAGDAALNGDRCVQLRAVLS